MSYPSDISREQFETIRPLLESARKRTKPRKLDLYEVFNALLYVVKTGCQWRALPKDYPKFGTVHRYFRIWSEVDDQGESILAQVLKKQVANERMRNGRKACTSMVIVDAQSVKNTESAHVKGYDGGKKVSGIKRHVAVDTQGLAHACAVTAANVTDRTGATLMLRDKPAQLGLVEKVLVDGAYTGKAFATSINNLIGAEVEVAKRSDLHSFVVMPKRWVVERSFSWLEKCRRLWKNCERLVSSSLAMMQLAFIRLLLKRL